MKHVAVVLVALLTPLGTPFAFDISAYCRQVADAVGGSYQIELACRQQEKAARSRLAAMQVPDRIRSYCTQVADAVGGSYQIMETCVEQELKAREQLK
jgi:hypothetical protein